MTEPDDSEIRPDRETKAATEGDLDESYTVDQPTMQIGRYELVRQLGQGGFGFVCLANDPTLRRLVAIKVPRWDKPLSEEGRLRFLREGQMLARANHPAIVSVYDVSQTEDGIPYVVMEYIEGQSLSQHLKSDPPVLDTALEILVKIAKGLKEAHQRGLVHRDFKPANVIITSNQEICLVDFGLALHDDLAPEVLGESRAKEGTPSYMAPEQVRGESHLIDGQTDIWAFGVTMYYMLTGKRPFVGRSQPELSRSICYKNPRPPRQLDDQIPKSLERICLRCIRKLIEERYQSMADLIEDLEAVIDERQSPPEPAEFPSHSVTLDHLAGGESHNRGLPNSNSRETLSNSASSSTSGRGREQLHLLPKGLRAFDQNDRDFFVQLLPGPKDRHGVPESIRFWSGRLDVDDQVEDIPVGLIYGPSGCGKSSFVRAGLIPSLSENVVPIYVDCTTKDLPRRIVQKIHHDINEVPGDASLTDVMRDVRRGKYLRPGDKLLLVLDQFEQWLNECEDFRENELTESLRQCESQRLQTLLLIRDEFWLSASQLLRCLEQRIEESRNAMPIPLFDERHARLVLEAFGRAYRVLPTDGTPLSRSQIKFLKEAVQSLSQRGNVICVHLAVFAETAKSRPWEYSEFVSVGGWEGIGREFITGIFTSPSTPAYIKKHSTDCWAILKPLLPGSESELKGNAITRRDLRIRSGLADYPGRFDELVNFLEFDAHLVSPVENSDQIDAGEAGSGEAPNANRPNATATITESDQATLIGLTHDFLVKPIRAWGTAKQNETQQGRADSLLLRLSNQWELTKDQRFLMSTPDFLRVSLFGSRLAKQQAGAYWKTSVRKSRNRLGLATAFLVLVAAGLLWARSANNKNRAQNLALQYFSCEPASVMTTIDQLRPNFAHVRHLVEQELSAESVRRRVHANLAFLVCGQNEVAALNRLLKDIESIESAELGNLIAACEPIRSTAISVLRTEFDATEREIAKSRIGLLGGYLGETAMLTENFALAAEPKYRTQSILQLAQWRADLSKLVQPLTNHVTSTNGDLLSGICSGLSFVSLEALTTDEQTSTQRFLENVYADSAHGGAHAAALHGLSKWGLGFPKLTRTIPDGDWIELRLTSKYKPGYEHRLLLIRVRAGSYEVGSGYAKFQSEDPVVHSGRVAEDYWICAFEIPRALYEEFLWETGKLAEPDTTAWPPAKTPFSGLPIGDVDYNDSLKFCAWFATKFPDCLQLGNVESLNRQPDRSVHCQFPSSDEFELANRAGSTTPFYFGKDIELMKFFVASDHRATKHSNQYPPNGRGLFDMVSNLEEYVSDVEMDWVTIKGGYNNCETDKLFSAYSSGIFFDQHYTNRGFRIVLKNAEQETK